MSLANSAATLCKLVNNSMKLVRGILWIFLCRKLAPSKRENRNIMVEAPIEIIIAVIDDIWITNWLSFLCVGIYWFLKVQKQFNFSWLLYNLCKFAFIKYFSTISHCHSLAYTSVNFKNSDFTIHNLPSMKSIFTPCIFFCILTNILNRTKTITH